MGADKKRRFFMKNLLKPFGIIVLVAIIGFTMASCVTASSIGSATGTHGVFSGNGDAGKLTEGAKEIASYSVILGLVDTGYAEYATAVKKAEEAGKHVTSVTKWLVFLVKVTAYAQ